MLKKHSYEDKTYEAALEKCLNDLNVNEKDIYIKHHEIEEGKIFKSKKIQIDVITKEEVKEYIKDFIKNIERGMCINIKSEVKEEDGVFQVILVSEENGILIGKEGRTLNALQHVLRQALSIETGFNLKVNLDAGNYRAKKVKNFEYEMKKIMNEVENSKVDATLDPMNSYERRIVHNLANKFEHITTSSEGEGKERHVIIHYNN